MGGEGRGTIGLKGKGAWGGRIEVDGDDNMNGSEKQVMWHQGRSSLTSPDCLQLALHITTEKNLEEKILIKTGLVNPHCW